MPVSQVCSTISLIISLLSSCFRLTVHARFRPPIPATQRNFVVDWKVFASPHIATCGMSRISQVDGMPGASTYCPGFRRALSFFSVVQRRVVVRVINSTGRQSSDIGTRSRNIPSTPSYAKCVETAAGSIVYRPSLQIGCPDTRNAVQLADVRASQDKTVALPTSSGRSLGVYLVTCKMSVQCMRSTVDLVNRAIPRDLQHPPRPSPSPTPPIRQAIPADVWYCADQNRPVGPLAFEGLLEKLVTLSNSADALVWCSKFSGWKRAADVSELKAHVLVPPPLPSPRAVGPAHDRDSSLWKWTFRWWWLVAALPVVALLSVKVVVGNHIGRGEMKRLSVERRANRKVNKDPRPRPGSTE